VDTGSIVHLSAGERVDPRTRLRGAWREIAVRALAPGESVHLISEGSEHLVYVWSGRGTIAIGGETDDLVAGTGVTILLGDTVEIVATQESLRLLVVSFDA
jgi:hypothetical protein